MADTKKRFKLNVEVPAKAIIRTNRLLFLLILPFYIFCLPLYIQGGDTAELVAASYHRLVAHPPGYPLFIWLQHLWGQTIPVSTVYWRASLLNTLMGMAALNFLLVPFRKNLWLSLGGLIFIGLAPVFIEAVVLPDVFSLHALFICSLGYLFLFSTSETRNRMFLFIALLSFSNHHTTLFMFPCGAYILWEEHSKSSFRTTCLYASSGLLACVVLYLSIFFLNPQHPFSWGDLRNLGDLLRHFLRSDYGTFKLSSSSEPVGLAPFFFFCKSLTPYFIFSGAVFLLSHKNWKTLLSDKRFIAWSSCLLLVCLFPVLMNVNPVNMGEEILKRFLVMPLIVLFLWTSYLLTKIDLRTNKPLLILGFFFTPVLIFNLSHLQGFYQLRTDSVIEDYSKNLLRQAKDNSPAVIVVNNDSAAFGIRYVQLFDAGGAKKICPIAMPLFFHPWYLGKIQALVPEFSLPNYEKIHTNKYINIHHDVVVPNLGRVSTIVTEGYKQGAGFRLKFLGLGRVLQEGDGTFFGDPKVEANTKPDVNAKGPQSFTKAYLYYQYAHFYLAQAVEGVSQGKPEEAKLSWIKALEIVPYAYPAMVNLCGSYPEEFQFCSAEELHRFRILNDGFFRK